VRLVLVFFLARSLGVLGFGKLTYANSYAAIFMILADFGISTLLVRDMAARPLELPRLAGTAATLSGISGMGIFALAAVCAFCLDLPSDTRMLILLICGYSVFVNIGNMFGTVFRARERMGYTALTKTGESVLVLILCLAVLFVSRDVILVGWMYLCAGIAYSAACLIIVRNRFARLEYLVSWSAWSDLIKRAFPLGAAAIIATVYYNVDMLMLGAMKGERDVGLYGAAYRIYFALVTMITPFFAALYPVLSRLFAGDQEELLKRTYQKALKAVIGVGLPLSAGTFMLASPVVDLALGPQFTEAAAVLRFFAPLILLALLNSLALYYMTSVNRQNTTLFMVAATTVMNVIINVMVIPAYGIYGAATATIVSESVCFILFLIVAPQLIRSASPGMVVKAVLMTAIMCAVICLFDLMHINIFLNIGIGIGVYAAAAWTVRFFDADDRQIMHSIMPRPKKRPAIP